MQFDFSKGLGFALIGLVMAALSYVSYQVLTNFRLNDVMIIAILMLILSGIVGIKRARSLPSYDIGVALLHLAGLLAVYMMYIIALAIFLS